MSALVTRHVVTIREVLASAVKLRAIAHRLLDAAKRATEARAAARQQAETRPNWPA
jgi:hypothetical protein